MFLRKRFVTCSLVVLACSLVGATSTKQADSGADAQEQTLTETAGVSVSNGKWTLAIPRMIVTQEFDGQKASSPSTVILVFPYTLTDLEGQNVSLVYDPILANFVDKDGVDLRLPTSAYYSNSLNAYYFQTFGPRALLERGLWVVPKREGGPPFPRIRLKANEAVSK